MTSREGVTFNVFSFLFPRLMGYQQIDLISIYELIPILSRGNYRAICHPAV